MPPVPKSKGAWSPNKTAARPASKAPARPPGRPASRPGPGGGRAGSPQGPRYYTPTRAVADTTHARYGRPQGGVEGRQSPAGAKPPAAPVSRAPSGAGFVTPQRPAAGTPRPPAGFNPNYVLSRRAGQEPPQPEGEPGLEGNALYNFSLQANPLPALLGDAARINFGPADQRLAAAAQMGRDIQGMNIPGFNTPEYKAEFITEAGQRLQQAQENINKPNVVEYPVPSGPRDQAGLTYGVQPQVDLVRSSSLTGQGAQDLDWRTVSPTGEVNVTPARRTLDPTPIQKMSRGAKEIAGMFLDVLNVPAKGVERFGARVAIDSAPILKPVPLPDGTVYTPTQFVRGNQYPGIPGAIQGQNGETVREVVTRLYGAGAATEEALRQVERIGYSGADAQLAAASRMLTLGQAPEAALYGDGEYVQNVLMDKGWAADPQAAIEADPAAKYWFDKRVAELVEKGLTPEAAAKKAIDQIQIAGLPGEQKIWQEVGGQVLLDPLNIVPSFADDILREMRAAEISRNFLTPTLDSADEVVAAARAELAPTLKLFGKEVRADWLPWVRTPTSVVDRFAEMGQDAVSQIVSQAKLSEGVQMENVVRALADLAEPAPVAAKYANPETLALKMAEWTNRQAEVARILAQYPVANSRAGKFGAALVRGLLTDASGNVNGALLKSILAEGGDPAVVAGKLFEHLENVKLNLFLPGRAGATTIEEFVKRTGKAPAEFPVLERFIKGAQERVALARGVKAGTQYPISPVTQALATWGDFQAAVNSGLWKVFAEYNPAYSARNFFNNLTTAMVDGTLDPFAKNADIDGFLNNVLGSPLAARRGIGTGGAFESRMGAGGFAGFKKILGIEVGAQGVEQGFSKRIVYKAAKDYLDRMLTIGNGIPNLPAGMAQALGDDVARGLVNELGRTYGDVGAALRWLKRQKGAVETWRIMGDLNFEDLRALDAGLANKVDDLLKKAKTPQEFQAGMNRLRQQIGVQVEKAARATPNLIQPGEPEFALLNADAVNPIPGDRLDTFQEAIARLRNQRIAAEAQAARSVEALAVNEQVPLVAVKRLNETRAALADTAANTSEMIDELRTATWAEYRQIQASSIDPNAKEALSGPLWERYFGERDWLWREYHDTAMEWWNDLIIQPAPVPTSGVGMVTPRSPETGGVPFFISRDMRQQLYDLGLSGAEVDAMTPQQAWERLGGRGAPVNPVVESLQGQVGNLQAEREAAIAARLPELDAIRREFFSREAGGFKPKTVWLDRNTGNWIPYNAKRPRGPVWTKLPGHEVNGWADIVVERAREVGLPVETIEDVMRLIDQEAGGNVTIRKLEEDIRRIEARLRELQAAAAQEVSRTGPAHQELQAVQGQRKAAALRLSTAERAFGPAPSPLPALVEQPGLTGAGQTLSTGFGTQEPLPGDLAGILKRIEQEALVNWGVTKPLNMTPADWQALQAWAKLAEQQINGHKTIAGQVGVEARNFALLNYGDKRNINSWLSVAFPYHFWYGGTYANWLKRAVLNPGAMANYGRYRNALATLHAGLPEYYRQQLTTDDLGISMENPLMFNLEATLSPLNGVMGQDFSDPARRRASLFGIDGVGAFAEDAAQFGPALWAPITWAMAASTARDDPESAAAWLNSYLGTPTRVVRAVSAVAGEMLPGLGVPPGGYNFDPQIWLNNYLTDSRSGMTTWERNRVGNAVFELWDNPPEGVNLEDWRAQIGDQFTAQKGPLWDAAKQQMFVKTAPAVLASFFLGVGFKGRGQEEVEFQKILDELANVRAHRGEWSPEQISLAYADIRERHPMYEVLMLARADGPERDNKIIWDAYGRVGIDAYPIWQAAGVSQATFDAFMRNKTVETLTEEQRLEIVNGALAINAVTRPKTIEEQRQMIAARAAKTQLNAQLAREFGADTLALEREFFDLRDQDTEKASAWLEALPPADKARLEGMWQARRASEVNNPALAAYVDVENYQDYAKSQFYTEARREFGENIQEVNDAWKQIREARGQAAASAFLKQHPELKKYWDAQGKFYDTELPQMTKDWLANLPDVPELQLREDRDPMGQLQEQVAGFIDEQASRYQMPAEQKVPESTGLVDSFLAEFDAEEARKEAQAGWLNTETRDAIETHVFERGLQAAGGDVDLAEQWYYNVPAPWGANTPVPNLSGYLGDHADIRQAMLADPTSRWAGVLTYIKGLTQEQALQLSQDVPGVRYVWEQLQRDWLDGPSEATRADVAGVKITFNIDGTVTVSRQTVKQYQEGLTGQGGGGGTGAGGGNYATPGGGPSYRTGEAPTANVNGQQMWFYNGRWYSVPPDRSGKPRYPSDDPNKPYTRIPPNLDWNKYWGGEGMELPGIPRDNVPYGGQYGPQPRTGFHGSRYWGSGPDPAQAWTELIATNPTQAGQLAALFNDPAYVQAHPEMAGLYQSYLAYIQAQSAAFAGDGQAGGGGGSRPRFQITRVYRQRSGESGL